MRLSDNEIKAIKEVIGGIDKDAHIYLFGSRVHDDKKGGDIDLFILSHKLKQGIRVKSDIDYGILSRTEIDIFIAEDTLILLRIAQRRYITMKRDETVICRGIKIIGVFK